MRALYVSSYCYYICVHILISFLKKKLGREEDAEVYNAGSICVSSYCYYICVLILIYFLKKNLFFWERGRRGERAIMQAICVLILLHMCPHIFFLIFFRERGRCGRANAGS